MGDKREMDETGKGFSFRDEAEGKLAKFLDAAPELEGRDPAEIIHELRIHQIELEMQNEELKRFQYALEESRNKYQDLYDFAPVGYFTLSRKGLIDEVNLAGAALFAIPRQKLIKMRFAHFVAPEFRSHWYQYIVSVLDHEENQNCDLKLKREDGSSFHVMLDSIRIDPPPPPPPPEGAAEPQGGNRGNHRVRIAVIDITERKRMEEAIKQSEEKFRTFADATYNWEYWIGPNGSLIYNSPSCERITEYLSHEFMNNPGLLELIVHPADRGLLLNHFSIIDSGDTCEIDFRIVTFTGQTRWIRHICLAVYSKDGQWLGRRASNMDITDRKLAEGQIKLNEARLSSLHEISQYKPDTSQELLDFTLEHAIKLTGSKIGYIYYYDEETQCFILNTWSKDVMKECKILEPQTVYELEKTGIWGEAVRQKKAIVVNYFMAPNPLKKGYPSEHVELLKFVTAPIFQGDKIVAVVGVANKESDYDETDVRQLSLLMDSVWRIVENQRAEEARKLLSTAIEQAAEGIIITDSIGIIQYVNPAEEAITGYNRDELIGRTPSIFKSDEHDEAFYWKIWETINAGNVWSGRFINKKKDGTEYHEDASISPVYDKSGNLTNFVALKHDVTKEIELQQQLLQAQKMEAIGTLTGGFAHDFNNLLQVIMGHLDVILSVPDLPEKIQSSLNNIDRAATSGAELIKGMLLYSKKMPFKLRPVDLSEIVAAFVTLIRRTIPREIKIEIVVADDLPVIKGDSTQIEQVLINLAINARDAMPDGGGLTIETRTTVLDEEFCRSYPDLKPGRYVLLSVMDSGKGMDQETVKHIYDPFFTTKEPGKGTGLGLSVVHGIVEKHGGKIICYSDPSVGTTFRIYFPAIEVPV